MLLTVDWAVPDGVDGIKPGDSPRAWRDRVFNLRRGGDNGFTIDAKRRRPDNKQGAAPQTPAAEAS